MLRPVVLCVPYLERWYHRRARQKSKGSSNPHNLVKATIAALDEMRSPAQVAQNRGISVEQVFKG